MAGVPEISKSFLTQSETVAVFFQQPGLAFYIPLYQREYSWDAENINQLMEDACKGVSGLLDDEGTIHFMGAVILLREVDPTNNIRPQDHRALPTAIDNVIDGQQRISTLSLLACVLYQRITELVQKLPQETTYDGLREEADIKCNTLMNMFSIDLQRGDPRRKPVVIRGSIDGWTLDGGDDDNYKSDVARYIARFIRGVSDAEKQRVAPRFPDIPTGSLVGKNLRLMKKWISRVEKAHLESPDGEEEDAYPAAWEILDKVDQIHIWSYDRNDLKEIVAGRQDPPTTHEKTVCSITQMFAFCHFLFQRCCLTLIKPVREEWAFDMFQSLNATGTPLTAVETFKPLVVNKVGASFRGSDSESHLGRVDRILDSPKSAAMKSKLTNDVLTTLALVYDGSKLGKQFSEQRSRLIGWYHLCGSDAEREGFLRIFGDLADYWREVIHFDRSRPQCLPRLVGEQEGPLATLCSMYLIDAGHRMAHTVLSRFYAPVLRARPGAAGEFIGAAKSVAAFFTIWRAALPNKGLDDVYRMLMRGDVKGNSIGLSWTATSSPSVASLGEYFRRRLAERGIGTKQDWLTRTAAHCKYNHAKSVCKFMLLNSANDTIPDPASPGLMMHGRPGTSPQYLRPESWVSPDFNTVEHVAPQRPSGSNWDSRLYEQECFHLIGNLTLLPTNINLSAGNRGWAEKLIYYRHLAETDPAKADALDQEARSQGIELSAETIRLLKQSTHKHHISSIVRIGPGDVWDKGFVDRRTERICSLSWDRFWPWLS